MTNNRMQKRIIGISIRGYPQVLGPPTRKILLKMSLMWLSIRVIYPSPEQPRQYAERRIVWSFLVPALS